MILSLDLVVEDIDIKEIEDHTKITCGEVFQTRCLKSFISIFYEQKYVKSRKWNIIWLLRE